MSEKKPSIVRAAVDKLAYSAQQLESEVQKKLAKTLYHQQTTAKIQEALVDSSLAIFDSSEDIEFRVRETIALVNLRMTGLQGREQPILGEMYDIWMEIVSFEWLPLLRARAMIERRLDMQGLSREEFFQRKAMNDIVTMYGEVHVIQWGFKLLVRSFGSEAEIPQFVVLATALSPPMPSDQRFRGEGGEIGGQ